MCPSGVPDSRGPLGGCGRGIQQCFNIQMFFQSRYVCAETFLNILHQHNRCNNNKKTFLNENKQLETKRKIMKRNKKILQQQSSYLSLSIFFHFFFFLFLSISLSPLSVFPLVVFFFSLFLLSIFLSCSLSPFFRCLL